MKKLFVIVDQSLSKRQQFVQGTHAVAQYLIDHGSDEWPNRTLVMLKYNDVEGLMQLIGERGIKYSYFREPYYDNKLTAISALNIEDLTCKMNLI